MPEQYDDHCHLTIGGMDWTIRKIERPPGGMVFHVWRWPMITSARFQMTIPGWEDAYSLEAARLIEENFG